MAHDCGIYELVVDLRGDIVAAGPGLARLCGASPEDLIGHPLTRVIRGPGLTAPYGEAASVTIGSTLRGSTPGDSTPRDSTPRDQPATAVRSLVDDHLIITVLPTSQAQHLHDSRDVSHRLSSLEHLVEEVIRGVHNPLTGVLGFARLSRLAPTPHRRRYYLDQVNAQAQRCRRLLAALDGGLRPYPPLASTFDLRSVTTTAVGSRRLQLEGHGISLELTQPPGPVWVRADPTLLGDAIACFITRGTLGMRGDYRARDVAVSCRPPNGGLRPAVRLVFSGSAVVSDRLPERFDPQRAGCDTAHMTLGDVEFRASCERLRHLGATLEIATSSDGEEVIVTVALPEGDPPRPIAQSRTPVPLDILAIDDDAMMGDLYAEVLALSGHTVVSAHSLQAARQALRAQRFDAVISDFTFSDGTLPELWAEASSAHPSLRERLLVVTGRRATRRVRDWLGSDGPPVLTKPFTSAELLSHIAALLH